MYSNILIPVALEHDSNIRNAMDIAHRLLAEGGKITALHVLDLIPAYVDQYLPEGQLANRQKETEARLLRELGDVKNVRPVVIAGHSGRSIVEYADEHDIDCIIIASHRPGLQDYFLGSTAGRVVRHANCPVHVIR
jgi:universal stress protein F